MLTGKKVMIFDLDGTLIDSVGIWNQVDEALIRQIRSAGAPQPENVQQQRDEALRRFSKAENPYVEYCAFLKETYGAQQTPEEIHTLRYEVQLTVDKLTAPVEKGQICGTATVYDGDKVVGKIELGAADAVAKSQLLALISMIRRVVLSVPMLIIYGILLLLLISYVIMSLVHNESRRKNKRKRVKHYK